MIAQVSRTVSIKDQAEAMKLVSALFFSAAALLLVDVYLMEFVGGPCRSVFRTSASERETRHSQSQQHLSGFFARPGRATEPDLPELLKEEREGMIGARDILVKIVSDTIFLADTVAGTLLVTIDAQGTDISGFDFTFAYDLSGVEIYDALPGDFPDSCNWEYFIVKRNPRCDGPCPNGLIKVIALAEFRKLERSKLCNTPAPGASLVKFLVRPTGEAPRQTAGPLRFFWIDCGDNTISSVSGNELFISRSVTETDSAFQALAVETEFPSYGGPIPDCFNKHTVNPPRRKIRFSNGTLTLMFENPGPDSLR